MQQMVLQTTSKQSEGLTQTLATEEDTNSAIIIIINEL